MEIKFRVTWPMVVGGLIWGFGIVIGLLIAAPEMVLFSGRWWASVGTISFMTSLGDIIRKEKPHPSSACK